MYPSLDITAHRSPAPRHRWRPLWGMLAAWALFLVAPPAVRAHDHETEHEGHHATTSIPAGAATITITDTLQPASLTVAPGTVIVFRNADDERHRCQYVRPVLAGPFSHPGQCVNHAPKPSGSRGRI